MDSRSPLDGIFNILEGGLLQGHNKPVKYALYNAVALLLLFLCCCVGWALFVILEPFMKPLIWAVLVGSVLHPIKRSLTSRFRKWFEHLERTNTSVVIGFVLLPINIINNLSEFIGDALWKHIRFISSVTVLISVTLLLYFYTPVFLVSFFVKTFWILNVILEYFLNITSSFYISIGFILYASFVFLIWTPENNHIFHYTSIIIWLFICFAFAGFFGSLGLPIFVFLQFVILGGFIFELYELYEEKRNKGVYLSISSLLQLSFQRKHEDKDEIESINEDKNEEKTPETCLNDSQKNFEESNDLSPKEDPLTLELFQDGLKEEKMKRMAIKLNDNTPKKQDIYDIQQKRPLRKIKSTMDNEGKKLKRSFSQPHFYPNEKGSGFLHYGINMYRRNLGAEVIENKFSSTFYLYSLLWGCGIMLFWKNVLLLPLLPLPILFYIFKHIGYYLGIWQYIHLKICFLIKMVEDWCNERYDALMPVPIRGLYKIFNKINIAIISCIKNSIDTLSSCVVILGLIIFLFCASVFIVLQIYAEAIMLVQITTNAINQTVVHSPELKQLLPPNFDDTIDSILDNAYLYGREGISKVVKSLMVDVDPIKTDKIEKQILELWDRIYQSWMTADSSNGPVVTQEAVLSSWEAFIKDIRISPEMLNIKWLFEFGKQNVGTLITLLDSIWSIVKGNINLVFGSVGASLSILLSGGTAVMNFILNVIVFLTTLFYLLNSSGDLYKPVEMLTNFSSNGNRLGLALEAAINGVFAASFKMAAFYGLWTWFIHNLFGVRIVYLPSAFATILGAVPFLGTYWAGVPAVLDLWLAQDRGISAIFFGVFQFLPTYIVDTTIYKELKGGHPYLTGLAVAGGVFCLGVEGAIIGPMLLCGLYVAMDLSSNMFKEESLKVHLRQLQNN